MGECVIACYRPKPGREDDLLEVLADRLPLLRAEGLATDRASITMRSTDGTVIEVSEWASPEAIEAAHTNPRVLELWARFDEVCEYVPVADVPEAAQLFSGFSPVD